MVQQLDGWAHLAQDPALQTWIERVELPEPPQLRPNDRGTFALLADCICSQQLSLKAAATIWSRLEAACGGEVRPDKVLELGPDRIRETGFSRPKTGYLLGLAESAVSLPDFEALMAMPDDEVVSSLSAHKGIGVWSAEMILIFHLGRHDVWPVGDLGVQAGVQRLLGLEARPGKAEMQACAEPWRPYRSWAALLMWRLRDHPI